MMRSYRVPVPDTPELVVPEVPVPEVPEPEVPQSPRPEVPVLPEVPELEVPEAPLPEVPMVPELEVLPPLEPPELLEVALGEESSMPLELVPVELHAARLIAIRAPMRTPWYFFMILSLCGG